LPLRSERDRLGIPASPLLLLTSLVHCSLDLHEDCIARTATFPKTQRSNNVQLSAVADQREMSLPLPRSVCRSQCRVSAGANVLPMNRQRMPHENVDLDRGFSTATTAQLHPAGVWIAVAAWQCGRQAHFLEGFRRST